VSLIFLKLTPEYFPSVCYLATSSISCGMNHYSQSGDFVITLSFKILTGDYTQIYSHVDQRAACKQTTCWYI